MLLQTHRAVRWRVVAVGLFGIVAGGAIALSCPSVPRGSADSTGLAEGKAPDMMEPVLVKAPRLVTPKIDFRQVFASLSDPAPEIQDRMRAFGLALLPSQPAPTPSTTADDPVPLAGDKGGRPDNPSRQAIGKKADGQRDLALLSAADEHTAIYDIRARAVFLPNGRKLEAHSGLGKFLDDPRSVMQKNRGVTPPNVYSLALREQPFHGVQALRLIPVSQEHMHGRDGMLAHSYMLGPNGQSNGCVSFKDYPEFLNAFLSGQVNRLVVVTTTTARSRPTRVADSR